MTFAIDTEVSVAGPAALTAMGHALDGLNIAICVFDAQDRTMLWNATFLRLFPEHDGHVYAGEPYRDNLYRFYSYRLSADERPFIDRYVADGVARHRSQVRPFVFRHHGRDLRVASTALPDGARIRVWTVLQGEPAEPVMMVGGADGVAAASLFASLADGALMLDQTGHITAANDEFLALYGLRDARKVVGRTFQDVVRQCWTAAGFRPGHLPARMAAFVDNARFAGAAFEVELPGGQWRRVIERRLADGTSFLGHGDISVLKRQQGELEEAERVARAGEERFRLLAENSGDVIVSVAHDGTMPFVSAAITRVLGWDPATVTGQQLGTLLHDDERVSFRAAALAGGAKHVLTCRMRHRDGGWVWIEADIRAVPPAPSQLIRSICSLRDITERVAAEQALKDAYTKLENLAVTDPLTGIANRRKFEETLARHAMPFLSEGTPISLLMIDIDHFKQVNDALGHQAGDACLQMVARLIAGSLRRTGDLAARFGGEEFVVVLPGTTPDGALAVAEMIRAGVEAQRQHDFSRVQAITVSVGIVTCRLGGNAGLSVEALVAAADRALYEAKRAGRNRVVVAPSS